MQSKKWAIKITPTCQTSTVWQADRHRVGVFKHISLITSSYYYTGQSYVSTLSIPISAHIRP